MTANRVGKNMDEARVAKSCEARSYRQVEVLVDRRSGEIVDVWVREGEAWVCVDPAEVKHLLPQHLVGQCSANESEEGPLQSVPPEEEPNQCSPREQEPNQSVPPESEGEIPWCAPPEEDGIPWCAPPESDVGVRYVDSEEDVQKHYEEVTGQEKKVMASQFGDAGQCTEALRCEEVETDSGVEILLCSSPDSGAILPPEENLQSSAQFLIDRNSEPYLAGSINAKLSRSKTGRSSNSYSAADGKVVRGTGDSNSGSGGEYAVVYGGGFSVVDEARIDYGVGVYNLVGRECVVGNPFSDSSMAGSSEMGGLVFVLRDHFSGDSSRAGEIDRDSRRKVALGKGGEVCEKGDSGRPRGAKNLQQSSTQVRAGSKEGRNRSALGNGETPIPDETLDPAKVERIIAGGGGAGASMAAGALKDGGVIAMASNREFNERHVDVEPTSNWGESHDDGESDGRDNDDKEQPSEESAPA